MGLIRKTKLTMHSKVVCKIVDEALPKYDKLGIKPYHHMVICGERVYVYIWDSRKLEAIVPIQSIDANDVTYQVKDNRMDILCKREDVSDYIWNTANEDAELMPIIFAEGVLTDHEQELLTIEHV